MEIFLYTSETYARFNIGHCILSASSQVLLQAYYYFTSKGKD